MDRSAFALHLLLRFVQDLSYFKISVVLSTRLIEIVVLVAFARANRLQTVDVLVRARPAVHFAIGLAALFGQLVPVLRLGQELAYRSLGQAQDVLGEDALSDVVHAEEVSDFLGDVGRV